MKLKKSITYCYYVSMFVESNLPHPEIKALNKNHYYSKIKLSLFKGEWEKGETRVASIPEVFLRN